MITFLPIVTASVKSSWCPETTIVPSPSWSSPTWSGRAIMVGNEYQDVETHHADIVSKDHPRAPADDVQHSHSALPARA